MIPGVIYTWDTMDVPWDQIDFLWNESWIIELVDNVIKTGGGNKRKGRPWDPTPKEIFDEIGEENTVKLIKMICIVNGKKYVEEKEIKDINVTIDDIKQTITEVKKTVKMSL